MAGINIGNLEVHLLGDNSKLAQTLRDTDTQMKSFAKRTKRIGRAMTKYVTLPMAAAGAASVKFFSDFDDKMTQSVAIMGQNGQKFRKEMEDVAKTISSKSIKAADELAESYFFLASAGLDAQQSMAALPSVTEFATAGMFDMAQATDLLTDAQSALGLTVQDSEENMQNMTRVSDVLVKANTLANASVEQFSTALTSKAATAMKSYNISLEEGTAVLAAYADQGIKAEYAGNMFDRMLRLTIKSINDNEQAWKDWGIETTDAQGNLLPIADILQGINEKTQDLGSTQKAAALEMLGFEARSQQAILPLIGLDENIRKYEEDLRKAGGITKEVSDKQLKSFSAQMKIVWNNVKIAGIEIGEILVPYVKMLGEQIKRFTQWIQGLNKEQIKWLVVMSAIAAAAGPVILGFGLIAKSISMMIGLIGPFIKALKIMTLVVSKVAVAFKLLFKVLLVGFKKLITLAWAGVKALIPYLPFIAVFTAIGLAVWVIVDAFTNANLKVLEFIRSFKVAGTSIGAWWDALGTFLWQSWDYSISKIKHFFSAMWEGVKEGGRKTWRVMLRIAKSIAVGFATTTNKVIIASARIIEAASEAAQYGGGFTADTVAKMEEAAAKLRDKGNKGVKKAREFYDKEIKKSFANSQESAEDYYAKIEKLEADYQKAAKKWADTRIRIFGKDDAENKAAPGAPKAPDDPSENPILLKMEMINEKIRELMANRNNIIAEEAEKGALSEIEREENKNRALKLLNDQRTDEEIERQRRKNAVLISGTQNLFGVMTQIAQMGGQKHFKTWKSFALAEATISAYQAFNNALASAPWPYNGPAAAAALASGLLQVRKIAMTRPGGGGGTGGGGSFGVGGGASFSATPNNTETNGNLRSEEKKMNHTTIVIENIHGSADEEFADMLADKIADRSGDGRTYGFETTTQ